MKKLLAVASVGGHWVQLMRLRPAFEGFVVSYVTTERGLAMDVGEERFYCVRDASMSKRFQMIVMAFQVFWVLIRVRPDVVISTGAAPGFFALFFGRLLGVKTVWVDSIANSEELSLAGSKVGRWADHWLTQWKHLEKKNGPKYLGAVI